MTGHERISYLLSAGSTVSRKAMGCVGSLEPMPTRIVSSRLPDMSIVSWCCARSPGLFTSKLFTRSEEYVRSSEETTLDTGVSAVRTSRGCVGQNKRRVTHVACYLHTFERPAVHSPDRSGVRSLNGAGPRWEGRASGSRRSAVAAARPGSRQHNGNREQRKCFHDVPHMKEAENAPDKGHVPFGAQNPPSFMRGR